jgi:hypothetical protein
MPPDVSLGFNGTLSLSGQVEMLQTPVARTPMRRTYEWNSLISSGELEPLDQEADLSS